MITLIDLKILESEASADIIDCSRAINSLKSKRAKDSKEHDLQAAELKRLESQKKKAMDKVALFKLIHAYLSSGVQMEGIKVQRNELMVKLASIKEREALEGVRREFTDKEHKRETAVFDAKYKTKKLRSQLKVLNFILR